MTSSLRVPIMVTLVLMVAVRIVIAFVAAVDRGRKAKHRQKQPDIAAASECPFVSVLVPAWNERSTVELCIRSLRMQDYPLWEVIVVAGGRDGTFEVAHRTCGDDKRMQVLEQLPHGKNAALNQGLRIARGDVIVLLDADSQVQPDWLRMMVKPLSAEVAATTGNYFPVLQSPISLSEQMDKIAENEIRTRVTLQGSGGIALRRDVIAGIGGFPEEAVADDWELDALLAMRGWVRRFCPAAILYTQRPATLAEWWTNELRWRRAHLFSLSRLRSHFFRDLESSARSLHPYILAWGAATLSVIAIVALSIGPAQVRAIALTFWVAVIAGLALPRASRSIEVAAFTGQLRWLRIAWVPPLLLLVTFVASCVASLTVRRVTLHFKGPRHLS